MYFPYIRGKQYDLLALRGVDTGIFKSVMPIIEPIDLNLVSYKDIRKKNIPFILIVNPQKGEPTMTTQKITSELINGVFAGYTNYHLGYIIKSNTTLSQIQRFLESHPKITKNFIHFSDISNFAEINNLIASCDNVSHHIFIAENSNRKYHMNFTSAKKVLVEDGFVRAARNADYPASNFFSDLYKRYKRLDYDGFGDFLLIGEAFKTGFAPSAIALHLSHEDQDQGIFVKHFVSNDVTGQKDHGGKYVQALDKLVDFLNDNPDADITTGTELFRTSYIDSHFPGLPSLKKISMIHHMELIYSLLN